MKLPPRYDFVRTLGRGAMGKVVLAHDRELDRPVAIKCMDSAMHELVSLTARFGREARVQAMLEHPHVVRLHEFLPDARPPLLVMEYVEGEDLDARLQRLGRRPVEEVLRLGEGLGDAVQALHDAGVLHRDLKPANVMMRQRDASPVVMDLGLASLEDATVLTVTGKVLGTPYYMPPEVAGGGGWGPAGDVYQLGAMLYEAATGRRRIARGALQEVLVRIQEGVMEDFAPGDGAPPALVELVDRATAREPDDRPFAAELAMLCRRAREGPVPAGAPRPDAGGPGAAPAGGGSAAAPCRPRVSTRASPPDPSEAPRGPAPVRRWWGPALVVMVMMFAFAAAPLAPRPEAAPTGGRLRIVGDALVASHDAGTGEAVGLEVDGERVDVVAEQRGSRRRFVLRGLPADRAVIARLVWRGGGGPRFRLQVGAPAVEPEVRLGPGGTLLLPVARPCRVSWEVAPERAHELAAGERSVPLPQVENARFTLVCEEEGIRSRLELIRRDIDRRSVERLLVQVGGLDRWALLEGGEPDQEALRDLTRAQREAWEPLLSWLPELLAGSLPRPLRRRLLAAWFVCQRTQALESYRSLEVAPLELDPGQVGSRFGGFPPWALGRDRTLTMTPLGGRDHDPAGLSYQLTNQRVARLPESPYALAATEVEADWPAELPAAGVATCLSLKVGALPPEGVMRVEGTASDGEPVAFELWHPAPAPADHPRHDGWLSVVVPAELGPAPGSRVRVSLTCLGEPFPLLAWVERARVAWRE